MSPEPAANRSDVIVLGEHAVDERIHAGYARVLARVETAAHGAGRSASEIKLVAVSKGHPLSAVEALYRAGHRDFGENRPDEGSEKTHAARKRFAPDVDAITWHMIGHVQSRKARLVAADFDYVHSLDSVKLARRLARAAGELGRTLPVLLECNVSGEASKYGFAGDRFDVDSEQQTFLTEAVDQVLALPELRVQGLMTMAPIVPDAEDARPFFRKLRALRDWLAERFPQAAWGELSMGMTDDFEVAVEEGATLVRVGRAIFGERR